MLFVHYPTFKALHQASIRIEDEEATQPKKFYQELSQPNQNTHPAETTLYVKAIKKIESIQSSISLYPKSSKEFNKEASLNILSQN